MADQTVPIIELAHGIAMPVLGLGTYPMDDDEATTVVADAVDAGYRLFDTAENYGNEIGVGRGLRASGVDRDELFVTSKFNACWHGSDLVAEAYRRSLERLGLDYLDLFLVHWPMPKQDRYVEAWEGLVKLFDAGLVRAIGTSNFKPAHLERIQAATGCIPHVNQIQLNPALARSGVRSYDESHGIVTESWAPLGGHGPGVLGEPVICQLAARYGKTPAQVTLRWHIDLGLVTVPRSRNAGRIRQNIDIFDFALAPGDLAAIAALDQGEAAAFDSDEIGN